MYRVSLLRIIKLNKVQTHTHTHTNPHTYTTTLTYGRTQYIYLEALNTD